MSEETLEVSAGTIAATVGTLLLVGLATLALYVDGAVLVYLGIIQPGASTVVAIVYVAAVIATPTFAAYRLRRRSATWRRTIAICAAIVLSVSALFLPFVAAAFMM